MLCGVDDHLFFLLLLVFTNAYIQKLDSEMIHFQSMLQLHLHHVVIGNHVVIVMIYLLLYLVYYG